MMRRSVSVLALAALAIPAAWPTAWGAEQPEIQARQAVQRRARAQTRELLRTVVDIQLQQLEENGLGDLPLAEDLAAMRQNLDAIVDGEMAQVIDLLARAAEAPPAAQTESLAEARDRIRAVVVALTRERQRALKRLRAAELTAQVRRSLRLQQAAQGRTSGVATLPVADQPLELRATQEDQEDVAALVGRLRESLGEISQWEGELGQTAAAALKTFEAEDCHAAVTAAVAAIEEARVDEAQSAQERVITGLEAMLRQLEPVAPDQGEAAREHSLREKVEAVRSAQAELKRQTTEKPLAQQEDAALDALVEEQAAVGQMLGELRAQLDDRPEEAALVAAARQAAAEAAEKLFEADDAAASKQDAVLRNLDAIADRMGQELTPQPPRSAEELAGLVEQLQDTKKRLDDVAAAKEKPAEERAAELAELAARPLPSAVQARLDQAAEATKESADKPAASPERQAAESAIQLAQAETAAALADAQRQQPATAIGELARAAEALERAAAAERAIAQQARQSASEVGASDDPASATAAAEKTAELARTQEQVSRLAETLAQAVTPLAPEASESIAAARQQVAQSGAALEKASAAARKAAEPANAVDAKPSRKESAAAAEQASQQAEQAASQLGKAASNLRQAIQQQADELGKRTQAQLDAVDEALGDVQPQREAAQALAEMQRAPTPAERQQAQQAAQAATQKAAGVDAPATQALQQAQAAAAPEPEEGEKPADADAVQAMADALADAQAALEARRERIEQDALAADQLKQLAQQQDRAAQQLAEAQQQAGMSGEKPAGQQGQGEPMNAGQGQAGGEPMAGDGSPMGSPSDDALAGAADDFANTQRQTGQQAAGVAQQRQLANALLREALEQAGALPWVPETPPPAETAMGSEFVPASPEVTAQMMAGPALPTLPQAAQADQSSASSGSSPTRSQASADNSERAMTAQDDEQPGVGVPAESAGKRGGDEKVAAEASPADQPWAIDLPPGLRQAIRSRGRVAAPRGYEERLERYFDSVRPVDR